LVEATAKYQLSQPCFELSDFCVSWLAEGLFLEFSSASAQIAPAGQGISYCIMRQAVILLQQALLCKTYCSTDSPWFIIPTYFAKHSDC